MKTLERLIENTILASRWILVVFYFGLSAALLIYSLSFIKKLIETAAKVMTFGEAEAVLAMLGLIDAALVGSLIVMVMISGYENFVSRFDQADESKLSWLGKLDAGTLKVKVASTIVAISSIHLLQVFLNAAQYENSKIMWLTIMHMVFVFSAVFLGLLDRIMTGQKKPAESDRHI
ncbi:MAG TPA: TIGR00645 family protein [Aestuariivirgaceae bacterium]|jgi:uncharacterized protein (TIGR00645 family)|nr:TIGR00645 family protein [Aestuariivirgaceae bacterium]